MTETNGPHRDLLTSERLDLLVFGLLHLISDFGDDEVLWAHLLYWVTQGVQAQGVLSQHVQQHGRPLGLCGPAADFLCVVPRQDPAGAQVVEVALGSDLVAEVVPQSGQHLRVHSRRKKENAVRSNSLQKGLRRLRMPEEAKWTKLSQLIIKENRRLSWQTFFFTWFYKRKKSKCHVQGVKGVEQVYESPERQELIHF